LYVPPCSLVREALHDPVGYDSANRRLNANRGSYCVLDAYLGQCLTNTVVYSTTAKRLVNYSEAVYQGGYCSNIYAVLYDSTYKRLKYQSTGQTGCW